MRDTDGHKTIRMLTQRGGPRNGTIDGRAARARGEGYHIVPAQPTEQRGVLEFDTSHRTAEVAVA